MRVLHVTSEVAPFSKTGGLGEVLGALPAHQRAAGIAARVVTPRYGFIDPARHALVRRPDPLTVHLGGQAFAATLWETPDGHVILVDVPGLLDRPHPYGDDHGEYADNPLRFAVFCRVAADLGLEADLVHLHDWQAGLCGLYLAGRRPLVHTIHNLAYQGVCDLGWATRLDVPPAKLSYEGLEFHGQLNLMKAGLTSADRLTTVSPRYAEEVRSEPGGQGLSGLFHYRRADLVGILNGLDIEAWNPATDPALPAHYDARAPEGKDICRRALLDEVGLDDAGGPVIGVVARAAWQKGLDLVADAAGALAGLDARVVILTDGDPFLVDRLRWAAGRHPRTFALRTAFDEGLARRIYAGADFVLVPSRFEPCGLTQMIGMRYGAVPVVRETGGLADTVRDGETGLSFFDPTPAALAEAVRRAAALYRDGDGYAAVRARAMATDWSWAGPVRAYRALYEELAGRSGGEPRQN